MRARVGTALGKTYRVAPTTQLVRSPSRHVRLIWPWSDTSCVRRSRGNLEAANGARCAASGEDVGYALRDAARAIRSC